jgi:hypothetical protein
MNNIIISYLVNVLLIAAFIIDRLFRLCSLTEFRDAKEAQVILLTQQLDLERANNDVRLTEMHKQRYENLKMLLDEKELEMDNASVALLELQIALQKNMDKEKLLNLLVGELERMERSKLTAGVKRAMMLQQLKA